MKQLTQSEIRKNGKVYKNVSSPATEGTMKQVTDIVEKDGTFSVSTDGGKTYSPAVGAVPEALPQEASALKSGNLPTSGWTTIGISTEAAYAYTISDSTITANSDILMELTDDGGVKSYSMEAGSITVIRDTVPTQPIPYTYKVKQTNASGQFTLVNHFVPNVPVTSVNGQTGAVTIAVPTKTSELTNDSGFITASDIPTIPTKTSQLTNDSGFVTNSAIGKGTLTIQKNGANVATFGANQSENATANISVPTKTSDLTNDSGFVTSADVPSKTSDLTNDSGFLTKNNIVAGDNVTVTDENGNVKISATGGGSGGGGIGNWQNATLDTELDDGTYLIQMIPSVTGQDAKVNTVLLTDGQSQQFTVLYQLIEGGFIRQQCAYFAFKKLYAKTASVIILKNEQQINMEFSEENLNENYSGYKYIKII